MKSYLLLILLGALLCPSGRLAAQSGESDPSVIARAGDIYITEQEFLQRYEFLPAPERNVQGGTEQSKLDLLYSIIAEKLLAQEALKHNLEKDSGFVAVYNDMREKLGREELYRMEIPEKVSVSNTEIARAIPRAKKHLTVEYIYCDNKKDAEFLHAMLAKDPDFKHLYIDTTFHAILDTVQISWGEAEEPLENAVYDLRRNRVSPVINAGSGYYIARVIKTDRDPYYSSLGANELRERVREKLRLRKERKRLDQYVSVALKDKIGYSVPKTFLSLAKAFDGILRNSGNQYPIGISEAMVQELKKELAPILDDTLMVAGDQSWSVGQVLDRLYESGFTFDSLEVHRVPERLNFQLKQWVQQEILGQEAIQKGLDRKTGVAKQLQMWYQYFLSIMMEDRIDGDVGVKINEVYSYMKYKNPRLILPTIDVRELRLASPDEIQSAMDECSRGIRFDEVARKWAGDTSSVHHAVTTESIRIDERPPIGELAWKTPIGQIFGPIKNKDDYSLFLVVAKRDTQMVSAKGFAASMDTAARQLLAMKKKRAVNVFLAESGEKLGFDIYQDRLKMLKVTHIPMMTYRILGFGGRITAVPFVRPRLDWLNIKASKGNIIF